MVWEWFMLPTNKKFRTILAKHLLTHVWLSTLLTKYIATYQITVDGVCLEPSWEENCNPFRLCWGRWKFIIMLIVIVLRLKESTKDILWTKTLDLLSLYIIPRTIWDLCPIISWISNTFFGMYVEVDRKWDFGDILLLWNTYCLAPKVVPKYDYQPNWSVLVELLY